MDIRNTLENLLSDYEEPYNDDDGDEMFGQAARLLLDVIRQPDSLNNKRYICPKCGETVNPYKSKHYDARSALTIEQLYDAREEDLQSAYKEIKRLHSIEGQYNRASERERTLVETHNVLIDQNRKLKERLKRACAKKEAKP